MTIKKYLSNIQYLVSSIVLVFLLFLGFLYRIYGLKDNYSFWTDEHDLAIFVRAILERGKPILSNGYFTGIYQWLQYWLSAISVSIFGLNEFSIRFPSVIFGVLTISAVYLLGKELFNKNVGLISAFFITFLKIEILWSRQARPYQALQFLYLLGAYFIYRVAKENKFNWSCFLGFLGCGIFASLMHGLGLVIFFSGFVYLFIFKASRFGKKWMLLGISLFVLFGWIFKVQILSVVSQIGKANNLFYYRVLLTHNYLPLCLLAVLGGFLLIWRKSYQELLLFVIFLGVQIIIDAFFLSQPFTRYFYPVFSFIILLASYGMTDIGNWILDISGRRTKIRNRYPVSNIQYLISNAMVFVVIFSMWKSDKLSLFPKKIYSLNADMQEVPEVDWKKIYSFVGLKLQRNKDTVLVANWMDTPIWFLGEGRLNYLVRKEKTGKDSFSGAYIINSLGEFIRLLKTQERGIFVLDSWDNNVPDGIREYCHGNLKREMEVDRLYPIQPRFWTVWVYSWGMD